MKRFFCALLCAVLLCGLSACADWDEQEQFDTLAQYYRAESKEPDTALTDFVLPYSAGETLDPVTCADGYQLTLTRLLYQGLYELDAQWAPQPVLAAGCSYDSQSRTYTVTLRSDAVFSDGTPIPVSAQEQIFVPFFTTKKEGSGIGLSISRQIMRNHDGTISLLRSDVNQTVFELRFR